MWNVPEDQRIEITTENFGDLLIESAKEALAIARDELAAARIAHTPKPYGTRVTASPPCSLVYCPD